LADLNRVPELLGDNTLFITPAKDWLAELLSMITSFDWRLTAVCDRIFGLLELTKCQLGGRGGIDFFSLLPWWSNRFKID